MSTRKLNSKYNLVVTSHADDETIFFGALILSRRQIPWKIVCVTDGNADGQGLLRKKQFEKACQLLKVKHYEWLGMPDIYEKRLNTDQLIQHLKSLPPPQEIFTHGILGEYGHPHHQDVSFAVHKAFSRHPRLFSVAWNCFPDLLIKINALDYKKKAHILADVYGSETRRFFNLLPATAVEAFVKLKLPEVETLYHFFREGRPLQVSQMKHFKWLLTHFQEQGAGSQPRLF
jgi:LmbE family N-acetylglucosaminyl deacetylase